MNHLDARFSEVRKIVYAFWITGTYQNNERRFVNDAFIGRLVPIGGRGLILDKAVGVAFDREDRNIGRSTLDNLIRNNLGTGKRRHEFDILAVLLFPFVLKRRINFFLQGFLHNGKPVNGYRLAVRTAIGAARKTTGKEQHR